MLEAGFEIEPVTYCLSTYLVVVVDISVITYSICNVGVDNNDLENSAVMDTVSLGSTMVSCLSAKVNSSLNAYCPVPVFLITLLP